MPVLVRYMLIVLIVLVSFMAAAWIILFMSAPGKAFLVSQIETRAGEALASNVKIGALEGVLPGEIILHDLTVADADGEWLTVDAAELKWRPFALLSKRIFIDQLAIDGANLLRSPPERPEQDNDGDALSFSLPRDLPKLEVREFTITDFKSMEAVSLNANGAVAMGGRKFSVTAEIDGGNGDQGVIQIDLAPGQDQLILNADITASEDGALAAFADLGGPVSIQLAGNGAVTDATITMDAHIGDFGALDMTIAGDLRETKEAAVNGVFTAGARLSTIPELSSPVEFNLNLAKQMRGGVLTINEITTASGVVSGSAEWPNARNIFDRLSAAITAEFAEDYRPEFQSLIGDKVDLSLGFTPQRNAYGVNARLISESFTAELLGGATNLQNKLSGDLSVIAPTGNAFPLIGDGGSFAGTIDFDANRDAKLNGFELALADGTSIGGDASYDFLLQSISIDADFDLAPSTVTGLAPSIKPGAPATGRINVTGPAENFKATLSAQTPQALVNGASAPAIAIEGAFAGLPSRPFGDLTAQPRNGAGKLDVQLRSSADGLIRAPKISYSGTGFGLNANGAYAPVDGRLSFDVKYEGREGAAPWPGLVIAGDLIASGNITRNRENISVDLTANDLSVSDTKLRVLKIKAAGPANAVRTEISAAQITTTQTQSMRNILAGAIINLNDATEVTINTLNAQIFDNQLSLLRPAILSFQEGVGVDAQIAWGQRGTAAIDANFSEARWRGDIALTRFNIPGVDSQIDMTASIDTRRDQLASADFTIRSLLLERGGTELRGNLVWNGESILIRNAPGANAADMNLSLPAILRRSPAISVTTEGPIDGYFRYDGDIELLTAYMPPELQSMEGALKADFNFAGTTIAPEILGNATLTEGAFTELTSGLSIDDIHAEANASFAGGQSEIRLTGGALGDGSSDNDKVTIEGAIYVGDNSRLEIDIRFDDAEFSAHPVNSLVANGAVNIAGPLNKIEAAGEIDIVELDAEIITPESNGLAPIDVVSIEDMEARAEANPAAQPAGELTYNVSVNADDRIFIRGRGMESEWSANVSARSDRGGHLLLGNMSLRRGWLDFSGRRFEFTTGRISFDRLSPNNPTLNIRAEHETSDGVTAIISITGRATEPAIELTSTPSLPQEDIMAIVLFGKPAGELTAVESLQTAQALAALGGIGPFGGGGLTGTLRQATGLDMLNFDIDPESGGGSLTIGKYVADGVFVSATQDGTGKGGAVRFEYEITDNISVESEIRQDGDQTVSANWKKDF
ncbi:MAG: hypothetical protein HKN14_08275 [Marinicaulis sp.]|nr:hypothetical protein [Marinicaulis sp.]